VAVPHGIIFNVIGKIAQTLLRVDNPDQDFRYLPVAPDLNNKRDKSYFAGLSCHQFYDDLLKKSLKAYIDDDKVIEGYPRIFSVDKNSGKRMEHVIIYISFFEDKAAMQKNKHFGAEPLMMRILNVEESTMTLVGFPPEIKTSKESLHGYLQSESKYYGDNESRAANTIVGVQTQSMRDEVIQVTQSNLKHRFGT
jgi:hypothetical protein